MTDSSFLSEATALAEALLSNGTVALQVGGVGFAVQYSFAHIPGQPNENQAALDVVSSLLNLNNSPTALGYLAQHVGTAVTINISNDPQEMPSFSGNTFPIININTSQAEYFEYRNIDGNYEKFSVQHILNHEIAHYFTGLDDGEVHNAITNSINTETDAGGSRLNYEDTRLIRPKCFSACTLIKRPDGSLVPISRIKPSDHVCAFNERDPQGQLQSARVARIFNGITTEWIELEGLDDAVPTRVTPGHRYLTPEGTFAAIEDILTGEGLVVDVAGKVRQITGRLLRASDAGSDAAWVQEKAYEDRGVMVQPAPVFGWRTYNFEVEGLHTYVAGGLRVHNECYQPGDILTGILIDPQTGATTWIGQDRHGAALTITDLNGQFLERSTTFGSNDAVVTTRWDELDAEGNPSGEPEREVAFPNSVITGEQIGSIFGSSLGHAIGGDNVFVQVASGTALSAVLGNVGETLHIYFNDTRSFSDPASAPLSLEQSADAAFGDFDVDLATAFQSQAIGAVSSFLTAELAESLDLGGSFGDQLLTSTVGSVTNTVLNNAVTLATNPSSNISLFDGVVGNVTTGVSAFIGTYLAHEIVAPENFAGSIGSSIGGAIGTAIGAGLAGSTTVIGTFGTQILTAVGLGGAITTSSSLVLGIILPGIGALIGTVLGTLLGNVIGDLIGGDQDWTVHRSTLQVGGTQFGEPAIIDNRTGNYAAYNRQLADATHQTIDAFLLAVGGRVMSQEKSTIQFLTGREGSGEYLEQNIVNVGGQSASVKLRNQGGWKAEDRVAWAAIHTMKFMEIAGGNLYIKRAMANTQATTLEQFAGELKIAEDYGRYLDDKAAIDTLIAQDPNSAFAAGWLITLLRAEELGITEMAASDFFGGMASFLKSFNLDRFDASLADVSFSLDGDTLNIVIDNGVDEARVYEIEDYVSLTGLSYLSADASGAQVTGGDASELWFADAVDSSFVDNSRGLDAISSDTLIGNSGNDTIIAGVGHDYIQGNGGNDTIDGGTGDDVISGGIGDDVIQGGLGDDVYVFERGDGSDTIRDFGVAIERRISLDGQETTVDTYQSTHSVVGRYVLSGGLGSPLVLLPVSSSDMISVIDLPPEQLANLPLSSFVLATSSNTTNIVVANGTAAMNVTLNHAASEVVTEYVRDANGNDVALAVGSVVDGGVDVLQFGHDITSEDVVAEISGQNLVLALTDPNNPDAAFADLTDRIVLENWLDSNQRVESLAFVDGTVITTLGMLSLLDPIGDAAGSVVGSDDVYVGAGADDTFTASMGDDIILGRGGEDRLTGGAGDDIILGGAGRDFLYGGDGDDILDVGVMDANLFQYAFGQGGNDTYLHSRDSGRLFVGLETGTTGDEDRLILTDLNLADLTVRYYDYGTESPHGNTLVFDWDHPDIAGQGLIYVTQEGQFIEIFEFGDGTTLSRIAALSTGELELTGTDADDRIIGSDNIDLISGGLGDDVLSGLSAGDTLDGGDGRDTADYSLATGSVTASLLLGTATDGSGAADTLLNIEDITGSDHDDILEGDHSANRISGGAGDDTFVVGQGGDVYEGGRGSDTISYTSAAAAVAVDLTHGTGTQSDDGTGTESTDSLSSVENVIGSAFDDTLSGDTRANALSGGAGSDHLKGGAGNDTYIFDRGDGADTIHDFAGNVATETHTIVERSDVSVSYTTQVWNPPVGKTQGSVTTETRTYTTSERNVSTVTTTDLESMDAGNDQIEFGAGITVNDLFLERSGSDLIVTLLSNSVATGDVLTIQDWDKSDNRIETFAFQDGSTLTANEINAQVHDGGASNDTIVATDGADVLRGGAGDDRLEGGAGNDTYVFSRGDGADTILDHAEAVETTRALNSQQGNYSERYTEDVWVTQQGANGKQNGYTATEVRTNTVVDTVTSLEETLTVTQLDAGNDRIEFGAGISLDDIFIERSGANLIISIDPVSGGTPTDVLTIENWNNEFNRVEMLEFEDGTVVSLNVIHADISNFITGTVGDDVTTGTSANDWMFGGPGDDRLTGGEGNDLLIGGAGSDNLHAQGGNDFLDVGERVGNIYQYAWGYDGNDTYVYRRDSGFLFIGQETEASGSEDVIRFEDLTVSDLTIGYHDYQTAFNGNALTLSWSENGEIGQVRIQHEGESIERFEFADGTTLSGIGVNTAGNVLLTGTSSNDLIVGGDGDDDILGGSGDDQLDGGAGSDTYEIGQNGGWDTIANNDSSASVDVLRFNDIVDPANLWFGQDGTDLRISVLGASDGAILTNWFGDMASQVDEIHLGDGDQLLRSDVNQLINAMAAYTDAGGLANASVQSGTVPTDVQLAIANAWT